MLTLGGDLDPCPLRAAVLPAQAKTSKTQTPCLEVDLLVSVRRNLHETSPGRFRSEPSRKTSLRMPQAQSQSARASQTMDAPYPRTESLLDPRGSALPRRCRGCFHRRDRAALQRQKASP